MVKAWCIWCEVGDLPSRDSGFYWIHQDCAEKLMDLKEDIQTVKKILEGKHRRNEKNTDELDAVLEFILDMENFKNKWDNTMKRISPDKRISKEAKA